MAARKQLSVAPAILRPEAKTVWSKELKTELVYKETTTSEKVVRRYFLGSVQVAYVEKQERRAWYVSIMSARPVHRDTEDEAINYLIDALTTEDFFPVHTGSGIY